MKYNFKYHLLLFVLTTIARLPLSWLYKLSDVLYFLVYRVVKYRIRVVRDNLAKVFTDKDEHQRAEIERGYYRHFCDVIVETVKLLHISDEEIIKRARLTNPEVVEQLASDGHPIVLYLGHYANWEWVQAITLQYRFPKKSSQIYRPVKDVVMNNLMLFLRSRFGNTSIPQKHAFRQLIRMYRNGESFLTGFIADQRPNYGALNHWTRFLRQNTAITTGGEEIGKHIQAHYAYLDIEKVNRGYYRMTCHPIKPVDTQSPCPYTLAYLDMLEKTIHRQPELWLWSHKRWSVSMPDNVTLIPRKSSLF